MNIDDKFNYILLLCCKTFDIDISIVKSKSRKQEAVYCRKAFCIITMDLYNIKYETISDFLGIRISSVWNHKNKQPISRYYTSCLSSITKQLKTSLMEENQTQ